MKKPKIQRIKDEVNKRTDEIKIKGLRQFIEHLQTMSRKDRIVFGFNVMLNRVRMR